MVHKENVPSTLVKRLRLEQKKELAAELVNALEQGELFPEDLDPELRDRLVSLLVDKGAAKSAAPLFQLWTKYWYLTAGLGRMVVIMWVAPPLWAILFK